MPVAEEKKNKARKGTHPIRVLVIEHSKQDVELCLRELERAGYEVTADVADDLGVCEDKIRNVSYDVILADYNLNSFTGMDAFFELNRCGKDTPFILVTGTIGEETAVDCIKLGVTDYVLKDRISRLPVAVRRALESAALEEKQHRTAKQLWASDAQLGLIFAQLPAIVWTTDLNLRVNSLNGMGLPRLGWRADRVIGCTLQEIYATEDRNFPPIAAHRRALVGQSAKYEHTHGTRQFYVCVEPLRDPLGNITGCLSLALDVTDSKEAEAALRESEERYRIVAETASDVIISIDDHSRILFANRATEKIFGYTPAEICGQEITVLMPDYLRQVHRAAIQRYVETGQRHTTWEGMQLPGLHKSGSEIPLEVSFGEFNKDGKRTFIGILRDVTERKNDEQKIQEANQTLEALIASSPVAIVALDTEGLVRRWNPAAERIFGWSAGETVGKPHPTIPADKETEFRSLFDVIRQGGAFTGVETRRQRKDGSLFDVSVSAAPLRNAAGTITGAISVIVDVTERRALERQLAQTQRHDAIGQLAGGIAHDFNNVLGAILGMAELGLMEVPEGSKIHDRLEKIKHHGGRAVALTRQLVAFAGRQGIARRDFNLNHAVAEIISLLGETLGKDIELRTKLAEDLSATRADPSQVEQVLLNLCLNSRDAMPKGGQLFIETNNASIDENYCRLHATARPGPYVCLTVSDTGAGMDATVAEHIFEPFFTTKGPGKGTGLGLATVYGIVKQHDGFIHVYSEPGAGATFRIYFPASTEAGAGLAAEEPAAPARGGRETILVADDHEGLRELVSESLQALGYRVLLAEDGEEALRQFNAHQSEIDLVVLDVVMPKLRGTDAFARMAALRPDLPAIFCTGYNSETPLLNATIKEGACVLQKPYTTKILAQQVRAALDGARRLPAAQRLMP